MYRARVIAAIWRQGKKDREFFIPSGNFPRQMTYSVVREDHRELVPTVFIMTDQLMLRTFGHDTIVTKFEANLMYLANGKLLMAFEAEEGDWEYFDSKWGEWLVPIRTDPTGMSFLLLAKFDQCLDSMGARRIANRPRRR